MFSTFILKLTEFCNLNCSYCYMFNSADRTHRAVPKIMSSNVASKFIARLVEYGESSGQTKFKIVLHGGEPSLWPRNHFRRLFDDIAAARESFDIRVSMQTNLVQVDQEKLALLAEVDGSFGVSLDGPREYHDQDRVFHSGSASYDLIWSNLQKIAEWGLADRLSGFLTVANPSIPPAQYFRWILGLPNPNVSILWPIHYNYDNLPQRDYGSWFAKLFRIWVQKDDPTIRIRIFRDAIGRMLGWRYHGDSIGNDSLNMLPIETDGEYLRHDYFRAYSENGVRTGMNLLDHELAAAARDPLVSACLELRKSLPEDCLSCRHVDVCGGGFLANRLKRGELPLARKSMMCGDHLRFFDAVSEYVTGAPATGQRRC